MELKIIQDPEIVKKTAISVWLRSLIYKTTYCHCTSLKKAINYESEYLSWFLQVRKDLTIDEAIDIEIRSLESTMDKKLKYLNKPIQQSLISRLLVVPFVLLILAIFVFFGLINFSWSSILFGVIVGSIPSVFYLARHNHYEIIIPKMEKLVEVLKTEESKLFNKTQSSYKKEKDNIGRKQTDELLLVVKYLIYSELMEASDKRLSPSISDIKKHFKPDEKINLTDSNLTTITKGLGLLIKKNKLSYGNKVSLVKVAKKISEEIQINGECLNKRSVSNKISSYINEKENVIFENLNKTYLDNLQKIL